MRIHDNTKADPPVSSKASEVATEDRCGSQELGLFIIWENAQGRHDRILSDLQSRFQVLRAYQVHWTPALVTRNFERFYSDLDVRGVYHVLNKGAGPFTAVTVIDPQPCFEARMTSRGLRKVNARFLEAKLEYRAWTRGLEVHCGETPWETNRDLTMLLGVDAQSYLNTIQGPCDNEIERLDRDLTGTTGWPSPDELFRVLNHTVTYVLIRHDEKPSDVRLIEGQKDIDLMTDDPQALHTIVNARPLLRTAPYGGKFRVSIDRRHVEFGIRFVGDQYYDARWTRELLASRVLDSRGFYRLTDQDRFETLAYHSLVHKPSLGSEALERLSSMAAKLRINGWSRTALKDPQKVKILLDQLLHERGYSYVQPLDTAVFYNPDFLGARRSFTADARRWLSSISRRFTGPMLASYLSARDGTLLRAPWVRTVKRFVTTNPFARPE